MSLFPASMGRACAAVLLLGLTVVTAACGAKDNVMPANTTQPDRFLYDRGLDAIQKQRWLNAREYFRQVVDNYPNSPVRPDAKLGLGDAFLGEGGTENLVLATNEYREFLTFYPTHSRADYAQFQLAMTHHKQMRAPERDQTETKAALQEFDAFFARFPNSRLVPDARAKWREARDRLSAASFRVGFHYYRIMWYPGAIDRFREILRDDPQYTNRDAVYFYLAESLVKGIKDGSKEAVPYYQRLVDEFVASEHLEEAKKRLAQYAPAAGE